MPILRWVRLPARPNGERPRYALWRAATHGGLACRHWWGTPGWPLLVETFVAVLDDPDHDHWGPGGAWRDGLVPEPAQVADRTELRRGKQLALAGRPGRRPRSLR
jgi:hypothetical protein